MTGTLVVPFRARRPTRPSALSNQLLTQAFCWMFAGLLLTAVVAGARPASNPTLLPVRRPSGTS